MIVTVRIAIALPLADSQRACKRWQYSRRVFERIGDLGCNA